MKLKITSAVGALALAVGAAVSVGAATASADTVINGCNIVSEPTTTRYTNCPGANFSGANLDRVDLSNANLEGADFTGVTSFTYTKVYNANLRNANFEGKNVQRVSWVGADASGANFVGADFSGIGHLPRLANAKMTGANLSKMTTLLGSQVFDGAVLKGANLEQSDLFKASMRGTDLTDAKLNFADLTSVQFSSSTKLSGADLSDTILDRVDFSGTAVMPKNIALTTNDNAPAVVSWSNPADVAGVSLVDCSSESGFVMWPGSTVVSCKVQSASSLSLPLAPGSGRFYVTVTGPPNPGNPGNPGNPETPDGGSGSLGSLGSPFGS